MPRAHPRGEWRERVLVLKGEGREVDWELWRVRGLMAGGPSVPGKRDALGIQGPGVSARAG